MSGGTAGTRRPLRGAALAVLSTLLTAVGHVAGGGTVPDLALLVVLFPLLGGVFISVAERGAQRPRHGHHARRRPARRCTS